MTLADLIRQFLEIRSERVKKLSWLSEQNIYSSLVNENPDINLVTVDNKQYFSNNIDSKNDRSNGFPQTKITRRIGVSKSTRVINLPDGSTQIETIIRDSNGNEEKHITTQKGDKKRTIVVHKDASGVEHTEERMSDQFENFGVEALIPPVSPYNFPNDSGYDFWFRKFFKPEGAQSNDEWKNEYSPLDRGSNPDEQFEKLIKRFAHGRYFDSFTEKFNNNEFSNEKDAFDGATNFSDYPRFSDSLFNEETRKLIESFENPATNSLKNNRKKSHSSQKHMEKILKSIAPPLPSSIFEKFGENAMIEIPEEETPLDRFVKLDDDVINNIRDIKRQRDETIKTLNSFFALSLDSRAKDVYSDIDDHRAVDVPLFLPKQDSRSITPDGLGEIIRKTFDDNLFSGSAQTRMFIENGKKRVETVRKNDEGLMQKTVSYEIGDRRYTVVVVIDKFGKQMKRDRNFNFAEEELANFKEQWSKNFHSDFEE